MREFSVDALFTVMLAAMIADITAIPFLGDKPFLSGFPHGIALHHAGTYPLVAALAVIAALTGLAFTAVLYTAEELCDRAWKGLPEWASIPLSVPRGRRLRPPRPELVLAPGDHVNLLTPAPDGSPARPAGNGNHHQPKTDGSGGHG